MNNWWNLQKSSWHQSLKLLWIMIIALQWLSYTEPLWYQETTSSVMLALTAVVVIEILIPGRTIYRFLLETATVLYVVYRTVKHFGDYIPDPFLNTGERLSEITLHMMPYLWFALGAFGLLLLSSWWVSTKQRILIFIGINIIAFAALDSFTSYILWQEVAWIVFAGMGWLVTQHLRSFQDRYPRGWSYLMDYPFKIIVNIAIIFSLIIVTGINMPKVKPRLTDPYTAWVDWHRYGGPSGIGSSTTGSGKGTGSATKNTSSGYSLNDDNLGGGFAFDYTPVMTVTSDMRTYMRGESRSVYSGKGWTDNNRSTRGPLDGVGVGQLLDAPSAPKIKTQKLQQTIKLLGNNTYPVIFGPYVISTVNTINGVENSSGLFWRNRDSELLWDTGKKNLPYPKDYDLTAEIPVIPVKELSLKTYDELYGVNTVDTQFLQLPDNFPDRVKKLAEEITAGVETPYEKTALLQQYLQQTFPYTNEPNVSLGTGSDLVENFLFEIKEGYCDYYSTALVTMARSLNIPARWVKGYAPGEQAELPDNIAIQQGRQYSNVYTITNADAHSWAEVYFGEYGWIPVEATPGFSVPLLTKNEIQSAQNALNEEEDRIQAEENAASAGADYSNFHFGTWAVAASGAVLLSWAGYLLWTRRFMFRFVVQHLLRKGPLSPAQKVGVETERWIRTMRRKGFIKEEHETLRESVDHWSQKRPSISGILNILLGIFEKAQYSPEVIEDKEWYNVYTEALRLRKSLKSGK